MSRYSRLPTLSQHLALAHERRAQAAAQHFAVRPTDAALLELQQALTALQGARARLAGVANKRLLTPQEKDALAAIVTERRP